MGGIHIPGLLTLTEHLCRKLNKSQGPAKVSYRDARACMVRWRGSEGSEQAKHTTQKLTP